METRDPGLIPRPTFLCRPQGKSYLYFTQFKAEVRGAEIEYGMAYVSISCALGVGAEVSPGETGKMGR